MFCLQKLVEALKVNESLRTINLESNYLSGPMIRDLVEALLEKQCVTEFRASNQRPQIMGNRIETEIAHLVQQNKALLKLGLNFDVPDARHKVAMQLQQNNDNCKSFDLNLVQGLTVFIYFFRSSQTLGFSGRVIGFGSHFSVIHQHSSKDFH